MRPDIETTILSIHTSRDGVPIVNIYEGGSISTVSGHRDLIR